MNWLAHLYLSDPSPEFRVGNLLPDLVSAAQLAGLPESFQKGIRCHRKIDRFTDAHPRVRACVSKFPKPYRRYGAILADVYFDYFLARDWAKYSAVGLPHFIHEVYGDIEICLPHVPSEAGRHLDLMRRADWLGSYDTIPGIRQILERMSRRFRRPVDLAASVPVFEEHQSSLSENFHAFFPELMEHLRIPD